MSSEFSRLHKLKTIILISIFITNIFFILVYKRNNVVIYISYIILFIYFATEHTQKKQADNRIFSEKKKLR